MTAQFAHLHVHTEYSTLDGAARVRDLVAEAARQEAPAVAITDHGQLHGAYDFFHQAKGAGVTPIIGIEAYVAPGSRRSTDRVQWGMPEQRRDDVSGGGSYTHMTMWARNRDGLHNLYRLSSTAYANGMLHKPRMDRELLAEHSDGLMATTGCPSGEVSTRIRLGQMDEALKAAGEYQDIFGRENFYVELMDHGIDIDRRARAGLEELARKIGAPFVVTNDSHYTYEHESAAHDTLLCVQTGAQRADEKRFRFDGSGYYLKSAAEMYAIDASDAWQEGCRTTLAIAERIDNEGMFEPRNLMPRIDVPEGYDEAGWLRHEAEAGLRRRFPGGASDRHHHQLAYELEMVEKMGFPGYFLVVADFIGWAKGAGIAVGPGRGSAAGSLVAYAMGITDLDPIEHGLIFERFLNPERVSMPDMDIDFDDRRRGEVIQYVTEKYGADKVAMIGTFGRIKAKNAIKDSARVLGMSYAAGDRITKAYPPDIMGASAPLDCIVDEDHPRYGEAEDVRALCEGSPEVREVIDAARGIEGLVRQVGVHAAGVIMSSEPIVNQAPLWTRPADGATITQWDYPTCEALGLLKMDFLGLRNLGIITDALVAVERRHGVRIDLDSLPMDDPKTYELLQRGDTLCVFQLDGGAMRSLLRMLKPDRFEDISAVVALYRPGPMGMDSHTNYALRKNGEQEVTPIHPEVADTLAEVLDPTHGLVIYQEQVQRAAQVMAGYSLGQADLLRRAMGKKKPEVLEKEFVNFQRGAREKGYSDEAIQAVWDVLVPFAGYAFNKAHSAAYGLISYRTAYLKANYPAEYMAAVLTSVRDDRPKLTAYLAECRRMGLRVLPPCVSESGHAFEATDGKSIRFGLTAVRGIGAAVVDAVLAQRGAGGGFSSLADFVRRVPAEQAGARALESLIKAGAFDSTGAARSALLEQHEAVAAQRKRALASKHTHGPLHVGGAGRPVDSGERWPSRRVLAAEREALGLYVSGHPLTGLEEALAAQSTASVADLLRFGEGSMATLGVLVSAVETRKSKAGRAWAALRLDGPGGAELDAVAFGRTWTEAREHVAEDAIVLVTGRLEYRDGTPQLVISHVAPTGPLAESSAPTEPLVVRVAADRLTADLMTDVGAALAAHPGADPVQIAVTGAGPDQTYLAQAQAGPALAAQLAALTAPFSQRG